jgi:hypothetical protein
MIKLQTIVAQRRHARFSSKHNALLSGDPLSMAIEERRRFEGISIRYSLGRKFEALRLYSQIKPLITQQPTVRFSTTMACFLAERHRFQNIEELRMLYNDFEESAEHAQTAQSSRGSPEAQKHKLLNNYLRFWPLDFKIQP